MSTQMSYNLRVRGRKDACYALLGVTPQNWADKEYGTDTDYEVISYFGDKCMGTHGCCGCPFEDSLYIPEDVPIDPNDFSPMVEQDYKIRALSKLWQLEVWFNVCSGDDEIYYEYAHYKNGEEIQDKQQMVCKRFSDGNGFNDCYYESASEDLLMYTIASDRSQNVMCSPLSCCHMILDECNSDSDFFYIENSLKGSFQGGKMEILKRGDTIEKADSFFRKMMKIPPRRSNTTLMNALNFQAQWDNGYESADVVPNRCFHNLDGTKVQVTMLKSEENQYIETDDFTGFVKDFCGNKYAFITLLPKKWRKGQRIWAKEFRTVYGNRIYTKVNVQMPEFETSGDIELTNLYGELKCELTDWLCAGEEKEIDSDQNRKKVCQKICVSLDHSGCQATAAMMQATYKHSVVHNLVDKKKYPWEYGLHGYGCKIPYEPSKKVNLRRPFLYAIIDREYGIEIVSGVVNYL